MVRRSGGMVIDGLISRADVARALDRSLPDGPFDTLGGFIMAELGRLPRTGDVVAWDDLRLKVIAMDGRRVDKVAVAEPDPAADRPGARGQDAR